MCRSQQSLGGPAQPSPGPPVASELWLCLWFVSSERISPCRRTEVTEQGSRGLARPRHPGPGELSPVPAAQARTPGQTEPHPGHAVAVVPTDVKRDRERSGL